MGAAIYYTAERATLLTEKEQEDVISIVDKYNESFKYVEEAESFDLYAYDDSESDVILAGATKVPSSIDIEVLMYSINHWLQCLTEIRLVVADAEWHVHVDDTDAVWVDDRWYMEQ